MKVHVNWGRGSALQIKRVSADSARDNLHPLRRVDEVLEHRDVRAAFDRAPHVPIAGTPSVSAPNGKLQVDLLFLGDIVALRVMDVSSK